MTISAASATLQPCWMLQLFKHAWRKPWWGSCQLARQQPPAPARSGCFLCHPCCHMWAADEGWPPAREVNLTAQEGRQVKQGAAREEYSAFSQRNSIWAPQLLACPPGQHFCECSAESTLVRMSLAPGYCCSPRSGWKEGLPGSCTQGCSGKYRAPCFALTLH